MEQRDSAVVPNGLKDVPQNTDLTNRFAVRATLYNEMTDAQARRIADATQQPPADSVDVARELDKVRFAWNYSPSPQPEQDFWALHDQTLQQAMAQVPPGAPPEQVQAAHNMAETTALQQIYPYRAELVGIGTRVLDDQVARAVRIKRLVEGQTGGSDAGNG